MNPALSDSKLDVDSEKGDVAFLEREELGDGSHDAQTDDIDAGFDPAFVHRTMRKVDMRLVPILAALYAISLIDRTNLGLARAANNLQMDRDIGTGKGMHYSIATLLFFVPYIIFEVPSQIGLRKFGPRIWLGVATVLWGVATIGMGWVPSWQGLAGLRAVLGLFEATLFPGATYLIATWYPRRQMASRNALFYLTAATVSQLFNPVAYCFTLLNGVQGHSGWRWAFTLYGIITVIIGVVAYIVLVDFPDKAKFLSLEQRELVKVRIERDRKDSEPDPLTWRKVLGYSCELKLWVFGFLFGVSAICAYSLGYFLPFLLSAMGFRKSIEQMLLGVPAYFYAMIPSWITAQISDRRPHMRAWRFVLNSCSTLAGTLMYSQIKGNKAARYAGVFLTVGGCQSNVPLVTSWCQCSIRAQSKRAVASALVIAWGGIGGILASVTFQQKEAKQGYPTGVWFTVATNIVAIVAAIALKFWMRRRNHKADTGGVVLEGDPSFRYQD